MAEIKCPNCGIIISLEPSELDSVVRQVRDEEFAHDLQERTAAFAVEKEQALKLARAEEQAAASESIHAKQAQIVQLTEALKAAEKRGREQLQQERARLEAEAKAQLTEVQAEAQKRLTEMKEQMNRAESDARTHMAQMEAQAQAQAEAFETQKQLAVSQAVAAIEKERDQLQSAIKLKDSEKAASEAQLREQMAEKLKGRDEIIRLREEELERLKDMKSRLSTKMVGESLEQHCLNEFNRIRAAAFPRAYFEKDNEAVEGTKGDFIFREDDGQGNEVISIMFEMKNESESDSRKTRNEDHLAKLDRDRMKKGCEYAVLVSLLEPDSELYNEGIVDVSYRYPKMYVIRPQFFIPMISLLRNAALNALEYKQEAALMRQQNLDITTFEADLESFKDSFLRSFSLAEDRFTDAIDGIDKTIKLLEKIRDNLTKSEKHLHTANNKLDDLTVKKLTRKNPTVRAMFDELHTAESEGDSAVQPAADDAIEVVVEEAGTD